MNRNGIGVFGAFVHSSHREEQKKCERIQIEKKMKQERKKEKKHVHKYVKVEYLNGM